MPPQTRSGLKRAARSSTALGGSNPPKATTVAKKLTTKVNSKPKAIAKPKQPKERTRSKRARHESAEPEAASVVKAPKRVKASAKLEIFMNMPIEVFIEIAKYLHPLELVLLSRVNKFFRELFMSRRASPIWRSALSNVPRLPPCPESLCEPQYAALLFTKSCSTCGKLAPRNMDPFLLVRLCTKCRDEQAVETTRVTNRSLVFSSPGLVPGKHWSVWWCLLDDAVAVKAKLNELSASADPTTGASWNRARLEEVRKRDQAARPLKEWLQARDKAREAELSNIKNARQKEIESRLLELGWEKKDFGSYDHWRGKQWLSLVHNTKPLSKRAWEELLPHLISHLEINREQRLERERANRRYEREGRFTTWIGSTLAQLDPLAQVSPQNMSSDSSSGGSQYGPDQVLAQSYPAPHDLNGWPKFKDLLEADTSADELEEKLDDQHEFILACIAEWRDELESSLLQVLPEDTLALDFSDTQGLNMTIGPSSSVRPISDLSVDLRKLIRADTIFWGMSSPLSFYPDDFSNWGFDLKHIGYHGKASNIAKALLKSLDRPNASFLEMKALGRAFQCLRCHAPPDYVSWRSLVKHYLDKEVSWMRSSGSRSSGKAKEITYIFTHDIHLTKPLVRIVADSDKVKLTRGKTNKCMLCVEGNLLPRYFGDCILEHMRDMHQISEPEEGKHYQTAM